MAKQKGLLTKTTTIDNYEALLGSGARVNKFMVEFQLPSFLTGIANIEPELEIMFRSFQMPGPRTIEPISVIYSGDVFKVAGDKSEEQPVTGEFQNTEDLRHRNVFELWMNTIQEDNTGLRTAPETYKGSALISQIDRQGKVTWKKRLLGLFPTEIPPIDFNRESSTEISITSVTFSIDRQEPVQL